MRDPICYIVGAGEHFPSDRISPRPGDLVIAADGGYARCLALGVRPDLVVGDFDSLPDRPHHEQVVRLRTEKDDTDTHAAVRIGRERGFLTFYLFGCTGGRFDHTLANLQTLAGLARNGGRGYLFGEDQVSTVIRDTALRFGPECEGTLSIFSFTDQCLGVSETGLKYGLDRVVLSSDFPIGVSNSFTGQESCITVERGLLTVVFPKTCWHL